MSDRVLHCWFDFEDDYWLADGSLAGGHTCLLEQDHEGPHEPTSNGDIVIEFKADGETP